MPGMVPAVEWPGFVRQRPDSPDRLVTFFDVDSVIEGKLLATGVSIRRHYVQIGTRGGSDDYNLACLQLERLCEWLDTTRDATVQFDDETYVVQNFNVTTPVQYIGDEEKSRRPLFTLTGLLLCRVSTA